MLQSKQISKVLSQALKPAPPSTSGASPLSVSLLSHNGLPLSTVLTNAAHAPQHGQLTPDNAKIYSLLALNHLRNQIKAGDESDWIALELDESLRVMIQKIAQQESDKSVDSFFVVIFYDSSFGNALAKLRLDSVCSALAHGLAGYTG